MHLLDSIYSKGSVMNLFISVTNKPLVSGTEQLVKNGKLVNQLACYTHEQFGYSNTYLGNICSQQYLLLKASS